MDSSSTSANDFVNKLNDVTENNFSKPEFGVSMLAKEMGMSRSNLHRKINATLKISASRYITTYRLKKAKEILTHTSDTVSEVAYKVGYNNVSYFIRCFHENYGYSPGEFGKRNSVEKNTRQPVHFIFNKINPIVTSILFVVVLSVVSIIIFKPFQFQQKKPEKKIAILPPRNWETNDSIAITAILQNVRDNLCKIKDIKKVVPWVSVLQYKNSVKPASVIARELKVKYLIQPDVQTINGKTNLSIPLIDGPDDKQLWTGNFKIDSTNITTVHLKIIKEITEKMDVSITATELVNIDKLITLNSKALNLYWEGIELVNLWRMGESRNNLESAIACFEEALVYDSTCASAYAQLARIYYHKDYDWSARYSIIEDEKTFSKQINKYADQALFYDSELDLSLLAKALYYNNEQDYEMAKFYLEKALEYNPNSCLVISYLFSIYNELGDTDKFFKLALNVINSDFPKEDNSKEIGKEVICYQLGIAYRKMGFFDKALMYLNMGIELNPDYTPLTNEKSQVVLDLNNDYGQSKEMLLDLIHKDSSNQISFYFLGLDFYVLGDFNSALFYFNKNKHVQDSKNPDTKISGNVLSRLASIYMARGEAEKAQDYIDAYILWTDTRVPKQKIYHLIRIYSLQGDKAKAIEQMKIYAQYNIPWFQIRLFKDEPIYNNLREMPEFEEILSEMRTKFQENRIQIQKSLEKKGLWALTD
ncbi:helix-turn-helix domain-containing protein [Prolixibacteraceae bacterium Z1-6]|uniref:Helix-turn-helix domain-containing protein n=1 Tax=Draconibacterium aestuarii TaxID=2998507 RepID=A0A9X3F740_9BACT|nr:helix-turn-helix domain-containing protein [Prolixibacteraceae bacterium Z1-6]